MKMLPEKEAFIRSVIRDRIAANPLVSIRGMQKLVEENTGRSISDKYVAKLMMKIRRQAIIESDRKKINERLAEVRERYRMLMEHLSRVIYWRHAFLWDYGIQDPTFKERLAAIKLLAQLESALFRTELTAGMFEDKQVAIEEMLRQGVLPTELQEQVIGVFRTWKLTPTPKENIIPAYPSTLPCQQK